MIEDKVECGSTLALCMHQEGKSPTLLTNTGLMLYCKSAFMQFVRKSQYKICHSEYAQCQMAAKTANIKATKSKYTPTNISSYMVI